MLVLKWYFITYPAFTKILNRKNSRIFPASWEYLPKCAYMLKNGQNTPLDTKVLPPKVFL